MRVGATRPSRLSPGAAALLFSTLCVVLAAAYIPGAACQDSQPTTAAGQQEHAPLLKQEGPTITAESATSRGTGGGITAQAGANASVHVLTVQAKAPNAASPHTSTCCVGGLDLVAALRNVSKAAVAALGAVADDDPTFDTAVSSKLMDVLAHGQGAPSTSISLSQDAQVHAACIDHDNQEAGDESTTPLRYHPGLCADDANNLHINPSPGRDVWLWPQPDTGSLYVGDVDVVAFLRTVSASLASITGSLFREAGALGLATTADIDVDSLDTIARFALMPSPFRGAGETESHNSSFDDSESIASESTVTIDDNGDLHLHSTGDIRFRSLQQQSRHNASAWPGPLVVDGMDILYVVKLLQQAQAKLTGIPCYGHSPTFALNCADQTSRSLLALRSSIPLCSIVNVTNCCCRELSFVRSIATSVSIAANTVHANLTGLASVGGAIAVEESDITAARLRTIAFGQMTYIGGDVRLSMTPLQALSFANITSIDGLVDLSENTHLTAVAFGALNRISATLNLNRNSNLSSIDFGALTHIGGELQLEGTGLQALVLRGIQHIGSIIHLNNNEQLQHVDLADLTAIPQALYLADSSSLQSVNLGHVTSVAGNLNLFRNGNLSSVMFPNLLRANGAIYLHETRIPTLAFSQVTTIAGALFVDNCHQLTLIDFGALTSILGTVKLHHNDALTSINFANLRSTKSLELHDNSILTSVDFASVSTVNGDVDLTACPQLQSVDFGTGQLSIEGKLLLQGNSQLTTLDFSNVTAINGIIDIRDCEQLESVDFYHLGSCLCVDGPTMVSRAPQYCLLC
ncbi:hypothetical protein PTSG_04244 [Salpingoeca rosetta]|uniref:Receptor L-domain domain-containing protein n=1 Tax=Salpingoeca rosetta (strain ATCC 50818 / BSB-021) TaxID=946362 RepID=F2U704_SALR5|nr:uncharacterized protein PTSG_04244 [Salpingoeca rosetta]EGD83636.1 hypothetical protein PTSG_04244 [Salpingoeca rosetta]|eukprot:XP_004995140.1 hypothetical protein PTSG_04244 [Salpingoeca rosetta]